MITLPSHIGNWSIIDSGVKPGSDHMALDSEALAMMNNGTLRTPLIRFFQWAEPVVTYGYLLDEAAVHEWAAKHDVRQVVQRPTGGGAVLHRPEDLNISLLWPRRGKALPENPRSCYAQIHEAFQKALSIYYVNDSTFSLFTKATDSCASPVDPEIGRRFSVCFDEPVCNDVMIGDTKVIGGGMRLTRQAVLYQGTIQSPIIENVAELKQYICDALQYVLLQSSPDPVNVFSETALDLV